MGDTVVDIENISNCGEDLETESPAEPAATDTDNAAHDTCRATTAADQEASVIQSEQTAVVSLTATDQVTRIESSTRSISARSEAASRTPANSQRDRSLSAVTEPISNGSRTAEALTISMPVSAAIRQPFAHTRTQMQPDNVTRDSAMQGTPSLAGNQGNTHESARREETLIEEPPPLYSNLFSESFVHNNCDSRHIPMRADYTHTLQGDGCHITSSSTVPRHSQCMPCNQSYRNSLHHCSTCYPPPLSHGSHHTGILLPGEIRHHSDYNHTSRQLAQHHSTVLPMHRRDSERDQDTPEDYLKLSFICVVLCVFHLNLPALLCVLPALAYSIMAKQSSVEGRYRQARKYSTVALTCNLLAFCQYIIVVLAATVLVFVVRVTLS